MVAFKDLNELLTSDQQMCWPPQLLMNDLECHPLTFGQTIHQTVVCYSQTSNTGEAQLTLLLQIISDDWRSHSCNTRFSAGSWALQSLLLLLHTISANLMAVWDYWKVRKFLLISPSSSSWQISLWGNQAAPVGAVLPPVHHCVSNCHPLFFP